MAGRLFPARFEITALHFGGTVLEVFTYPAPEQDSPWRPEPDPDAPAARLTPAGAKPVSPATPCLLTDCDGVARLMEAAR